MKIMVSEENSPKFNAILKSSLYWLLFLILLFIAGSRISILFPVSWSRLAYGISGTLAALLATWILLRSEKKSFAAYGLLWQKDTLLKFLKGIVIGTAIFLVIILILVSFTELNIERNPKPWNLWAAFWYLPIIPLALMEEIAFRAYPLLKLNKAFGFRITQVIVALAFALYHIIQGWDTQITFLGPGTWAFVFGLSAIWSNGIAVPTGIHVALNILQPLLGMKSGELESIWLLKQAENISAEVSATDTIGLMIQILVFLSAVLATELYIRGAKTNRT